MKQAAFLVPQMPLDFHNASRLSIPAGNFVKTKTKILIVENDTPIAMQMVALLTHAGCDVSAVHTGKKGMELARENKFDLIVLAVELLDISAFDIASELKQRHLSRHTPVVFVSEKATEGNRQRALELNAADYITKPFNAMDFAPRILSHITQKASTVYRDNEAPVES